MAKDPAFLFYPNDYIGGTMGMTFEEKGAYMELLVLQYNKGAFTIDQAKKCLNGYFEKLWNELKEKFKEQDGKFFNERLEKEKNRRKEFAEKQSLNGKKGGRKPKINPTLNPNTDVGLTNIENRNKNEIKDEKDKGGLGEKEKTFFPDKSLIGVELDDNDTDLTVVYVEALSKKSLLPQEVERYWKAFKIQYFKGRQAYTDWPDVIQHFRDWLKIEVLKSEKHSNDKNIGAAKEFAA